MNVDLNESEQPVLDQGVPISKLLEIIGKQTVEWIIEQEAVGNIKAQAVSIYNKSIALTTELDTLKSKQSEPPAPSPELEQMRRVIGSNGERVKQLEDQVHTVALERDAQKAAKEKALAELTALQTAPKKSKR